MSYSPKYRLEWSTRVESNRVDIELNGYTGSVTDLTPGSTNPLSIEWGQQGRPEVYLPLMVSTARIRVLGDDTGTLLSEIFGASDTDYRVRHYTDQGTGWSLNWSGFLATDLWEDSPNASDEQLEMEAIDGLALLERRAVTSESSVRHAITDPLLDLQHGLDVLHNMQWRPYNSEVTPLNDAEQVGGTDDPLGALFVPDPSWENQREQVEDILERFGMRLVQTGGVWYAAQRHTIDTQGTQEVWTTASGGSTTELPSTSDLLKDLSSFDVEDKRDRPRSFVERAVEVSSTYNYEEPENFVQNGGFESGDLTGWDSVEGPNGTVDVRHYNTLTEADPKQDNEYAAVIDDPRAEDMDNPGDGAYLETSGGAPIYELGPAGGIEWSYTLYEGGSGGINRLARLKVGTYSVVGDRLTVPEETLPADDDGIIPVQAVPGADGQIIVAEGTELPIYDGPQDGDAYIETVTLDAPVYAGDTELVVGSFEETIPEDARVTYWHWTDVQEDDPLGHETQTLPGLTEIWEYMPDAEQTISVPSHAPDGTPITGRVDVRYGSPIPAASFIVVDDVRVTPTRNGDPIDSTIFSSIVAAPLQGRSIDLTHTVGDGPTSRSDTRLRLSSDELTSDWIEGSYSADDSPSGVALEELLATTVLRYQRSPLKRYQYTLLLEEGQEILPHHVVSIDGELYTVTHLRRSYGKRADGMVTAEVELTQLKDHGTTGLAQSFQMGEDSSTGAGGGGGTSSTVVYPGGVADSLAWADITGKPSIVQTFEGRDGAVTLTDVDVETALGYTPFDVVDYTPIDDVEAASFINLSGTLSVAAGIADPLLIGDVQVDGILTAQNDVTVQGFLFAEDMLEVYGDAIVGGDLEVAGDIVSPYISDPTLAGDVQVEGSLTAQNDATIQGNLTVLGTRFEADVQTVEISDNLAVINAGETGSGVTAGFSGWRVDRGTAENYEFGFDEGRDRFVVGKTTKQVVATREDAPIDGGLGFYNSTANRFETDSNLLWNGNGLEVGMVSIGDYTLSENTDGIFVLKKSGTIVFSVDGDGNLVATGDVSAFGSDSGGGGGGTSITTNAPITLTGSDPATIGLDYSTGLEVVNGALRISDDFTTYDSADFDTDFAAKSTSDLSEGSNLYFTDNRAQNAVSDSSFSPTFNVIDFANHEQSDFTEDGRLFWDLSAGLYIRSSNAQHTDPALLWSSANFTAGSNLNVSYGNEDEPTLSVVDNPQFDTHIGFGNDNKVIEYDDTNSAGGFAWSGKDAIRMYGDGNVSNLALYVGHLKTTGNSEIDGELYIRDDVRVGGLIKAQAGAGNDIFRVTPEGQTGTYTFRFDDEDLRFWNNNANEVLRLKNDGDVDVSNKLFANNIEAKSGITLSRGSITTLDFVPGNDSATRAARIASYADGYTSDPRLEFVHKDNTLLQLRGPDDLVTVKGSLEVDDLLTVDPNDGIEAGGWLHLQRYNDNQVRVGDNSNADLSVANNLEIDGVLKVPSAHSSSTFELRAGSNTTAGVSIRATNNPSNSQALFAVESSGGATRFGVTQDNGGFFRDALNVGYTYDDGEMPSFSATLRVNGNATVEGHVRIDSSDYRSLRVTRNSDSLEMSARNLIARDNNGDPTNRIDFDDPAHVLFNDTSVLVDGDVEAQGNINSGTLDVDGYTFAKDSNGDLVITTPTGNKVKIFQNGDIGAFQ